MLFYKVTKENEIIDVVREDNCVYVKMNSFLGRPLRYNKKEGADGILSSDGNSIYKFEDYDIKESENDKEYEIISEGLAKTGGPVSQPQIEVEDSIDLAIDFLRERVIKSMSDECKKTITAGFDLNDKHYSLEITDQINITQLAIRARLGENELPYHADGEAIRFYSSVEVIELNNKMEDFIAYHQAYYNNLKQYILSLKKKDELLAIEYGMKLPNKFKSEILKKLEEK